MKKPRSKSQEASKSSPKPFFTPHGSESKASSKSFFQKNGESQQTLNDKDPANRPLNKNINGGKGDRSKAGLSFKTGFYAEVSMTDGNTNFPEKAFPIKIAAHNNLPLTKLYEYNTGLEAHRHAIGQGQLIYTKKIVAKPKVELKRLKAVKKGSLGIYAEDWSDELEKDWQEYLKENPPGKEVPIEKEADSYEKNERMDRENWRMNKYKNNSGDRIVEKPGFWGIDKDKVTSDELRRSLKDGDTLIYYNRKLGAYMLYKKSGYDGIIPTGKKATNNDVKKFVTDPQKKLDAK